MEPQVHANYSRIVDLQSNRANLKRCSDVYVWLGRGPARVVRLCVLMLLVPTLLLAVPLYLRYHVLSQHLVPLANSDMRMVDYKMSTTWCQRQLIRSNVSFNAYLLPRQPAIHKSPNLVKMTRRVVLEDDMKEYWGFYLLEGSTATVSSCARRAGASLIVIRGHHHLRECAYIGDNSSEEQDELLEIRNNKQRQLEKKPQEKKYSNRVLLQKARPEVKVTGMVAREGALINKQLDMTEHTDEFDMSQLVAHHARTAPASRLHTAAASEPAQSSEMFKSVIQKLKSYERQGKDVMSEIRAKFGSDNSSVQWLQQVMMNQNQRNKREGKLADYTNELKNQLNKHDQIKDNAEEQGEEMSEVRGTINGTTANDASNSEYWSSFSSSEERLLECDGLILSQPMTRSDDCDPAATPQQLQNATRQHRISYTVPGNGYYFFVFSSENEIERNFIQAEFELERMVYDVASPRPVASCNATSECALPLHFLSHERLVLELPVNESLWNGEFVVVSQCEPRTALYVACVVAVPILILLCAF